MKTSSASWREVLPIHPAAQMLPPLPEEELRVLGEDIKARGLLHPVYIFEEPVGRGGRSKYCLLDGVNRLDAMELVGVDFKIDRNDRFGWTVSIGRIIPEVPTSVIIADVDPYAFVLSVNLHRRHLTVEQKRDLIAKVLKAQPSKSNRQVAKMVGVSHPYVAAVRAEFEKSGDVETVTTSIDTKGRKQPTRKPAKEKCRDDCIAEKTANTAATEDDDAPELAPEQIDPDHLISQFTVEVRSGGLDIAKQIEATYRPRLIERLHEVIDEIELEAERWAKEAQRPEELPDISPFLQRSAP